MDNFSEWWAAMSAMEQVYWVIAVPASLIFLIFMILTFVGGDVDADTDIDIDGDIDGDIDTDDGIPFQFITLKNLVGFFTVFAWTGLACIHSECSMVTTIISSSIAGILMMLLMASIFYFMSKLTEDGSIDLKKAIGLIGEVYLIVGGKRKSMGKVQLKVEGTFQTLNAITDDEDDLATGSLVKIVDVTDNNILIVSSNSKQK